jgi:hypothetical protein
MANSRVEPQSVDQPLGATSRIDKRVAQFIRVRDEIKQIEDDAEKALVPWKVLRDKLIGEMLQFLDQTGQKSAKTSAGTVSIRVDVTASCSDPDAFIDYVREHDAYELLDRRANKTACRDFAEQHGTLPPGVKLSSKRTVGVTKA